MDVQFRYAEITDLPKIVDIYNSTIASKMVTADTSPVTVESRVSWFYAHNNAHRPLWIIAQNGWVIGWMSFQSFYGRPAYDATVEVSIYLDETARGKKLGKQVLQYAIDISPQFGIQTLLGFIFAHNLPSLRLFRGMGFIEWAHLPDIALLDGKAASLKILGYKVK